MTLRKCCACHEICLRHFARQRQWDLRPCQRCGKVAPATKSILGLAKVLRLPRNLYFGSAKFCACHENLTLRNLRVAVTGAPGPRPSRDRPEQAPRQRYLHSLSSRAVRQDAGILPLPRNLHFLIYFKSLSNIFQVSFLSSAILQLVSVPRKLLLKFL